MDARLPGRWAATISPAVNDCSTTGCRKAGSRFEAGNIDYGVRALLEAIGELGYPFPRWVVSDLRLDAAARTVTIVATLLPGTPARIGPVTSDVGDPRAERFLARASGLQPGAPLRGSDLRRAVERLWARDLYAEVDTARVYTTTAVDTVGVHFPARLRPPPEPAAGGAGAQPARRHRQRHALSGEVDLRLPNLASSGRALHVGWRDDGAGRSRFGFSWLEPLAFGTPLDVTLALDSEVQRKPTRASRPSSARACRWSRCGAWNWRPGGTAPPIRRAWWRARERTRARAAAPAPPRRPGAQRLGRQLRRRVGLALVPGARGNGGNGRRLPAAVRQKLLSGDLAGEAWLGRRAALAARGCGAPARRRRARGAAVRALPLRRRRLVRGYREDEFHGVEAAWASLEWRLGPPRGSRLYTFWDVGYFEFWSAAAGEDAGGRTPARLAAGLRPGPAGAHAGRRPVAGRGLPGHGRFRPGQAARHPARILLTPLAVRSDGRAAAAEDHARPSIRRCRFHRSVSRGRRARRSRSAARGTARHRHLYYDEAEPEITDAEYDALVRACGPRGRVARHSPTPTGRPRRSARRRRALSRARRTAAPCSACRTATTSPRSSPSTRACGAT